MQAGVDAFFAEDVEGDFLRQAQRLAIKGFHVFQIGGKDVIGVAGRNALSEFSVVVGVDFPLRFLIFGTADLDWDTVDGMVVRSPDGSGDQGVGLLFVFCRVFGRLLSRKQVVRRTERRQENQNAKPEQGESGSDRTEIRSNHRLRFPLLRSRLPRNLLPLLLTPAEWS